MSPSPTNEFEPDTVHPPCTQQVLLDDEVTRVTYYKFRPQEGTGWHRHELPHVVIIFSDGQSRAQLGDGRELEFNGRRFDHVLAPAGTTHNVWNSGDETRFFLEVEFKEQGGQPDPGV